MREVNPSLRSYQGNELKSAHYPIFFNSMCPLLSEDTRATAAKAGHQVLWFLFVYLITPRRELLNKKPTLPHNSFRRLCSICPYRDFVGFLHECVREL